jgi:hypothetical protein
MILVWWGYLRAMLRGAAPLAVVVGIAAVLLRFPPESNTFYPQCPIYVAFHLECPGCGGTRALAALLHGHVGEALRSNALVTLMLPLAVGYGCLLYWRFLRRQSIPWPHLPSAAIYVGLIVAAVFTVQRNFYWQ